jgi:hypothetical protein
MAKVAGLVFIPVESRFSRPIAGELPVSSTLGNHPFLSLLGKQNQLAVDQP